MHQPHMKSPINEQLNENTREEEIEKASGIQRNYNSKDKDSGKEDKDTGKKGKDLKDKDAGKEDSENDVIKEDDLMAIFNTEFQKQMEDQFAGIAAPNTSSESEGPVAFDNSELRIHLRNELQEMLEKEFADELKGCDPEFKESLRNEIIMNFDGKIRKSDIVDIVPDFKSKVPFNEKFNKVIHSKNHKKNINPDSHKKNINPDSHEKNINPDRHEMNNNPDRHEMNINPDRHEMNINPDRHEMNNNSKINSNHEEKNESLSHNELKNYFENRQRMKLTKVENKNLKENNFFPENGDYFDQNDDSENKILKNKISALKDVSTNPSPARSNPLDDVLQNLVGKLRITEERYGLDARTADVTEFRNTRWAEFNLCGEIRDALAEMHYEYPSPVQFRTLKCFRDRSILVRAKNGTGKTAAYLIPILNQLAVEDRSKGISRGKCMSGDKVARRGRNQRNCFAGLNRSNVYPAAEDADSPVIHRVRAIIMLPTRELALQVSKVAKHIASKTDLLVMPTFGGSNLYEDILRLKKGVDVVVTTPGRIFDLVKRRVADFSECRILVVDEADKLVSAEYAEELETIIQNLKIQQLLLFSATFPKSIDEFVRKNMRRPLYLNLMKEIALKGVTQFYALVRFTEKLACLKTILRTVHFKKCVIFCNSIRNVELLAKKIAEMGYPHYYIHSKMTQDERNRVFHNFADHFLQNRDNKNGDDIDESSIDKNGKMNPKTNKTQNRTKILVSSDLVTRGIDVPTINLVINFDFPRTAESYIHRIGRCGRFGTEGISVSLICDDEKQRLIDIETKLGVEMLPVSDPQFLTFGQSMAE